MTFPPWPLFFQNDASAPSFADYCQTFSEIQISQLLLYTISESILLLPATKSLETKFDNIWHFLPKL